MLGATSLKDLLKCGEFADLCGTTKETLRHYNDIGLLEPAHIAKNGYRLYSPAQTVNYLIISTLKSAGFTLDEIRRYFAADDIRKVDTLFQHKYLEQLRRLREIEANIHLLEKFVEGVNDAQLFFSQTESTSSLISLDEAFYVQTPLIDDPSNTLDLMKRAASHAHLCKEVGIGLGSELTSSYRLTFSESTMTVQELCVITYFKECAPSLNDASCVSKRPAGQYLEVLYPLSDSDTEYGAFAKLDEIPLFISKKGGDLEMSVSTDIFISEIGRYSTEADTGILVKLRTFVRPSHELMLRESPPT